MRVVHVAVGEVDVISDHLQRRMPEDLLETEWVASIADVLGRAGVPQSVRRDAHSPDTGLVAVALDHDLDMPVRHLAAVSADEEKLRWDNDPPPRSQVGFERLPGDLGERHAALLAALAHDQNRASGQIHVGQPQA